MDGLIVLNKPQGISSFQAANKAKKIVNAKKAGHCGTLDPMAEGVLLVLLGKATRLAEDLVLQDKEYLAEMQFGIMTDTLDIWGNVIDKESQKPISRDRLLEALSLFKGKIMQIPPIVSAIKKDGIPLYNYARRGITIELEPRPIEIFDIELVSERLPESALIKVNCSKGTYIRSLCRDIAQSLGSIGVMSSLLRVKSGKFTLSESVTFEELERAQQEGNAKKLAIDCITAVDHLPSVSLTPEMNDKIVHGISIPTELDVSDGTKACLVYQGKLAAIATIAGGMAHAEKVLSL